MIGEIIFGNLKNKTFLEIWNSKKLNEIRKKLKNSNRNFNPCNKCDVLGTIIGQEHFQQWSFNEI